MDILYLLIPLSSVAMLAIVGVFAWALHRGQFEGLEDEGARILFDAAQAAGEPPPEESKPSMGGAVNGRDKLER